MDSDLNRSLMEGIVSFARERGNWSLAFSYWANPVEFLDDIWQNVDGVLLSSAEKQAHALLDRIDKPRVGILMGPDRYTFPSVTDDDAHIIQSGVDHLRRVGFQQFAYIDQVWNQRPRRNVFIRYMKKLGLPYTVLPEDYDHPPTSWDDLISKFVQWAKVLPKPVGVIVHHMELAHHLTEACHMLNIHIPEQIGIIGHACGDFQCHLAWPPVSYLDAGGERMGYAAAQMLEDQIIGRKLKHHRMVFETLGVVQRQSTNLLCVEDDDVAAALRYIRENVEESVTVRDVLRVVPRSRRSLEYAFEKLIGRSIHQEIIDSRLELAKQLLRDTDLKTIDIALRCGFNSAGRLSAIFMKHLTQTPSAYRRAYRNRSESSLSGSDYRPEV